MKVFIANFGRGNEDWPLCLREAVLATRATRAEFELWGNNDREGYIAYVTAHTKTVKGVPPIRPVASRWFNLMSILSETRGDLWIHRQREELWWTISGDEAAQEEANTKPGDDGIVLRKRCAPWRKSTETGAGLHWGALHPKARDFLFTEGTLQQLNDDYAGYAQALLKGEPLDQWHTRPVWKQKLSQASNRGGIVFDARQRTIVRMAMTALGTIANSNGQIVERRVKNKDLGFNNQSELERYIASLLEEQEGLCAITDLPLQLDNEDDDQNLRCSLDRIDSSGHYAPGNLQIVCKFINGWKSASDDGEFRRLIALLRDTR